MTTLALIAEMKPQHRLAPVPPLENHRASLEKTRLHVPRHLHEDVEALSTENSHVTLALVLEDLP